MSVLNSCVEVVPGVPLYGSGGSSGGGGGGGITPPPIVIQPINAPAGGAIAPAITLNTGVGGANAWVEGLVNQATGTPANSGNDLVFQPYADGGTPLSLDAITFQRKNGSVIANNLQIQDVVYSPMITNGLINITGGIGFSRTSYTGNSAAFPLFTPVDTGLYVFEGNCSCLPTPTAACFVPAAAFFSIILAADVGQTPNPGYRGGSITLKPFPQPVLSVAPTGDRGESYTITSNNSFLLQAGINYKLTVTAINPVSKPPLTNPQTAETFGFFDSTGAVPDTSGSFVIYAELYSLCRVNAPYTPGVPT